MAQPVVHFEIIGKEPAKLRSYFGELFGWEFDTSSPVAEAVSEPDDYGFVNRSTTSDGTGIPGGVGGGADTRPTRCSTSAWLLLLPATAQASGRWTVQQYRARLGVAVNPRRGGPQLEPDGVLGVARLAELRHAPVHDAGPV